MAKRKDINGMLGLKPDVVIPREMRDEITKTRQGKHITSPWGLVQVTSDLKRMARRGIL